LSGRTLWGGRSVEALVTVRGDEVCLGEVDAIEFVDLERSQQQRWVDRLDGRRASAEGINSQRAGA
jgi:hypothetical protein